MNGLTQELLYDKKLYCTLSVNVTIYEGFNLEATSDRKKKKTQKDKKPKLSCPVSAKS